MPSKQSEAVRRRWEAARLAIRSRTWRDPTTSLDEHARKAGLDTRLDVFPGMLHTFQMAAGRAPEADDAIRKMAAWVRPRLGL